MSARLLTVVLVALGALAAFVAFSAFGRTSPRVDPEPAPPRRRGPRRLLFRTAAPGVAVAAAMAAVFFGFAYPALFPPPVNPPVVEIDPAEGKVWLDSEVVIELRGSFTKDEVLDGIQVRPDLDIGPDDVRVEQRADLPLHNTMPWAITRVTINPSRAALFRPETKYEISVRGVEVGFETITVPKVLNVTAEADDGDRLDVPTGSAIVIAFNEQIPWRDEYLTVTPETEMVTHLYRDTRGRTLVRASPATRFENSTQYEVQVHPGIRDVHNHTGGEGYSFTFETWAQPNVVGGTPVGVTQPVDQPLRVEFERPVDRAAVEASFATNPPIPGAPEWENDRVILWRLAAPLAYSTDYTASVAGLDSGGDSFLPHSWSFRTQDLPIAIDVRGGTTAPTILEAHPSGGLGNFTYQWSTGDTGPKTLVNVPFGETWTIEVRVASGDQTAVQQVQVGGWAYQRTHTPTSCPTGYEIVEVSICYREETLPGPVRVYVARIDRGDPDLDVHSAPAADILGPRRTVGEAAASSGALVAVNGDFFHSVPNGTVPVGPVVTNGGIAALDWRFDAAFAITKGGQAFASGLSDAYLGLAGDGGTIYAQDVNGIPPAGGVAIFNSYWGSRLDLPWDGCWATMIPAALYTLSALDFTCGPLSGVPLPRNRAVIVAREGPGGWLERSAASPIYLIDPLGLMGMDLLVGGSHALIQGEQPRPLSGLHQGTGPRTAIGVDAVGFLYLVVVDGRSENSGGMTMPELQGYLQTLGLVEAVNMDGGGSSAMVMFGQVRNVPSDGAERPVAGVITVTRPRADCGHPLVRC